MKKKIIAIVLLIVVILITATIYPAYVKTSRSSRVWRQLQDALANEDWTRVRQVLTDTDRDLHDITEDRIVYFHTHDYTQILQQRSVRFWKTMEYYLTDPKRKERDKVILTGGYAMIDNDQITFMKFP